MKNLWNFVQRLNGKHVKQQENEADDRESVDARGRKKFSTSHAQPGRPREFYESWPPNETDYARVEHPRDREDGWEWEMWRLW